MQVRRGVSLLLGDTDFLPNVGEDTAVGQDARIGSEVAGYRIESEIGRGGMSVVYLAEHLKLKRRVALKLISSELAADQTFRDRFVRESELAASLEDPNIVPIYDAGEADGVLYIAMRHVDGTDLKRLIQAEGPLEVGRALSIISQTARGLGAAHAKGLVHRDVKPGNILLTSSDHVYLSDFGLTKRMSSDSGYTATGQFVGTLDYAAPEQFEGKPLDPRTDVYSLGCVLYECLAGEPPYKADNQAALVYAHLLKAPPHPTERRPELPTALDEVVATAMAKAPEDRFPSAGALAEAARSAAGEKVSLAARAVGAERAALTRWPGPDGRERWWTPRRVRLVGAGAMGAVALLAVSVFLLTRSHRPGQVATRSSSPAAAASASDSVWRLDPTIGRVLGTIRVADGPGPLVIGEGSVWVANTNAKTVSRIDPVSNKVAAIKMEGRPYGIAVGGGYAWVIDAANGTVVRIDPTTNRLGIPVALGARPAGITFSDGEVWVTTSDDLVEIDPSGGDILKKFPVPAFKSATGGGGVNIGGPDGPVAIAGGAAWLTEFTNVLRVDLSTGRVREVAPRKEQYCDIGSGAGAVWVLGCSGGTGQVGKGPADVFRLDPSTGNAGAPISVENGGRWFSVGPNNIWILGKTGSVSRLNLIDDTVRPLAQAGRSVGGIAVGGGTVWVSVDVA